MSRLSQRTSHRRAADPNSAGVVQPPGHPPDPATAHSQLGLRDRGRARRRLRYLRKLHELQLRDLGGLVFDLYRFGEKREPLVREKLDRIIATDKEERALEERLGERRRSRDLREPGVGGTCPSCGELHSSNARFCSRCGTALAAAAAPAPERDPQGRAWASELADAPRAGELADAPQAGEPAGPGEAEAVDAPAEADVAADSAPPDESARDVPSAASAPEDEELPVSPDAEAATNEVETVADDASRQARP